MVEQKSKIRRLLIVLAGIFILGSLAGGIFVYRIHYVRARFLAMRASGLKAADAGDASQAVDLLGQYLARYPVDARDPVDVRALSEFARNVALVELPKDEQIGKTIWALRYLLRVNPERLETRGELMKLYSQVGDHAEALDAANTILKARIGDSLESATSLSPTELTMLGKVDSSATKPASASDAESANRKLAASEHLIAELQKFPDAVKALGFRTKSLHSLHEYPEALHACAWWADAASDDVEPALVRVELLQENHRPQETAMLLADKWIAGHSVKTDDDLLRGHTCLAYGIIQQAISALTSASTANPSSRGAVRFLANDLDTIRKPELARAVLIRLVASDPKDKQARCELIGREWDSGHLGEVVELSASLPTAIPPTYILGLRATALMMLDKKSETAAALQPLIDRKDDPEAVAWAVVIQQSIDRVTNPQQILKSCRSGLERNPRDYYLRHFMAEAYTQIGEREPAIHEWETVVDEDRAWALPAIRLSTTLLEEGLPEQAMQAATTGYSRSHGSVDSTLTLAEAWVANVQAGHTDNSDQCQKLIDELCSAIPHDGRPIVLKTAFLAATGQIQPATDVIQQCLAAPDAIPESCWIRLASISETKHLDLESKCLARSQREHGLSPTLAYAKAVALHDPKAGLASFDADAAESRKVASTEPVTPAGQNSSQSQSAELGWNLSRAQYLELTHDPGAADLWTKVADGSPSDVRIQQLVLSVQSARADKALSARCIDRLGQLVGRDGLSWRAARARWLVMFAPFVDSSNHPTAEATEARNLLTELVRAATNSADFHILSAQAFERMGKLPEAVNEARVASNLSPSVVSIRLYLARLLQSEGDFEAVRDQLGHFTDAELQGVDQKNQAASLLAQEGQTDRAIGLLEEDARAGREANTASLLLAQLYQRRGEFPKAEAILKKLLANNPDSATLRFGADLMASRGRMAEAHTILDNLGKDGHTPPGVAELIRADFALRYESAGGPNKAIGLFEAATKASPGNSTTWRALAAVNLCSNRPEQALAAANAGLKAIPGDATLTAIAQQPQMLTFVANDPELQPILLAFVNDPGAGSVAAQTLGAIFTASKSKEKEVVAKGALATRLRELMDANPRFAPLQVYLAYLYAKPPLKRFDDAITVASEAVHALPYSRPVLKASTDVSVMAERWPEALAAALRWRDNVPDDKTDPTLIAADIYTNHLDQPLDAINLLKPLIDPSSPKFDAAIVKNGKGPKKYVEAQIKAGVTPDLAVLMQPLLTRETDKKEGCLQWMEFAVTNLPVAEADGWLQRAGEVMPSVDTPDGVLEHIALSEMYGVLANRANDPTYAKKAREILLPLTQAANPDPKVFLAMGTRLDSDKDWDGAATNYRRALAALPNNLKPDDFQLLLAENNLAMALARTGHAAEALPFIDAAIKAKSDAAELYDTRAFVRTQAGQVDPAVSDIRQAIQLVPQQPRFRLRLVQMLFDAKRQHDAAVELKALDGISFEPQALSAQETEQLKDLHTRLSGVSVAGQH